jgi:tryptophanyl-tRNA synthetase
MTRRAPTRLEIPEPSEPLFPARIVSGVQPSGGGMDLGTYFGAVREHTRLQYEYPGDAFFLIADYHALTAQQRPECLRAGTEALAVDYLALGLDPCASTLYRQSDVPQVCELMWILACATRRAMLDDAPAYVPAQGQEDQDSLGLFLYPALMTADILALRGTDVPVGNDQRQHLEIACRVATAFNRRWSTVFPMPRLRSGPTATALPRLKGQRTNNIDGSTLPVFWADEAAVEACVRQMVKESPRQREPADPNASQVLALYGLLAATDDVEDLCCALAAGSIGPAEVAHRLLQALRSHFAPFREKRREIAADGELVEEVLRVGARRVRAEAEETLDAVRERVGLAHRRRLI